MRDTAPRKARSASSAEARTRRAASRARRVLTLRHDEEVTGRGKISNGGVEVVVGGSGGGGDGANWERNAAFVK